ncbi:hypothetical protein GCM10007160_05590 [Litchfieldella qijiaojingensis]|uniref:Tetratricopeptide repeat protein n=1 Tax=Litchfieldella qijiaojingensis TaxID=980347 RepID=A0ABQ2YEP1_9GAMM|nr:hypothetical protein [Halomonas qijiaojingensis]GGX81183.1 hypothetical protein GCM10007160_05590 [Halomonas qijiaojingensis]
MSDIRRIARWRLACVLVGVWAWCTTGYAAPPLSSDMVRDLETLQQRLAAGEAAGVAEKAQVQAQRLEGGNAADRWARALYLQLAATAVAQEGRYAQAADWLRDARGMADIDTEHRARWLRQEARLRLRDGQTQEGSELLGRWLAEHSDAEAADLWLMAQAQVALSHWEEAVPWVERAMRHDSAPSEAHLSLAASVYQRVGQDKQALQILDRLLAQASEDADQWRRAAGLAQRLGEHGQAAALWEAGWRRGALSGRDDLLMRIRLHLAGGTPARAGEILQAALDQGELADSLDHRRLLAQAWTAARDRRRALQAWRAVAQRSGESEDWMQLGQLAYAWGEERKALEAWRCAHELGAEEAVAWLERLKESEGENAATPGIPDQASHRGGNDQSDSSVHTGA